MTYRLHGAPAPFPTESPNSWLQRIAHRYDLSFAELQDALGARWTTDADVEISRQAYGAIARVCGRPVAETSLMYSMLGVGQGATVALRDPEGRPLYRFCVGCFQDDTVPHLRIEWRLMPWKVCPQHLCRLQSRCVGCHKPWMMETAVLRDRRSKARTLAHCRWCGLDQRQTVREQPSPKLAYAADFGRAVVSALANRHAVIARGLSTTRVNVSFLLKNLDHVTVWREERYVNLVMDQAPTIGTERRLALQRAGVDVELRGRTGVLFDRHHLGIRDGGRKYKPLPPPDGCAEHSRGAAQVCKQQEPPDPRDSSEARLPPPTVGGPEQPRY